MTDEIVDGEGRPVRVGPGVAGGASSFQPHMPWLHPGVHRGSIVVERLPGGVRVRFDVTLDRLRDCALAEGQVVLCWLGVHLRPAVLVTNRAPAVSSARGVSLAHVNVTPDGQMLLASRGWEWTGSPARFVVDMAWRVPDADDDTTLDAAPVRDAAPVDAPTGVAAFLLARIAEDEAVATDCLAVPMGYSWRTISWLHGANREHGVRHDPKRVLAECAAKRRAVEGLLDAERAVAGYDNDSPDQPPAYWQEWGNRHAFAEAVAVLAAVYADHPDYDQAWRIA